MNFCTCGVDMRLIKGRWVCPACEPDRYHTGDFMVSPWNGADDE